MKSISEQYTMHKNFTKQLTLGELISELEKLPLGSKVQSFTNPHSYRGYYEDLCFEPQRFTCSVEHLLALCKSCIGATYYGYKGGEYIMSEDSILWVNNWGCCASDNSDTFSLEKLVPTEDKENNYAM